LWLFQSALLEDFHVLRDRVEKCGLYRISIAFYMAIFLHILFLDFLGWWTMKTFGTGWLSYIAASVFLATAQVIFNPSFTFVFSFRSFSL